MDDIVAHLIEVFMPIIKAMVDLPEAIEFGGQVTANKTVMLGLRLDRDDTGKIIGRQGRHAESLRALMHAVGCRYRCRVILEILE